MNTDPRELPEVTRMKRRLHARVRRREFQGGWHYYLNLRVRGLRGERIAIRDPSHPGWPDEGPVARSLDEALEWSDTYVGRLGLDWCRGVESMSSVADHAHAYLARLLVDKGADSSSYRNSRSHLRRHILPTIGRIALRKLAAGQVQDLIDEMRTVDGRRAGHSLKEGVLGTLSNIWQHAYPRDPVPWRGEVGIDHRDPGRARRERAASGIRRSRNRTGFTLDELRWILTVAVAIDIAGQRNPMKRRGIDNSQDLIAFLTFHMVRIEEVCFMRGFDFRRDLNAFLIPGTKTAAAEERLTPIQRAYQPWLERLLSGVDRDDDFLFPTSRPTVLPSVHTAKGKVLRVLDLAGLKRPGQLTHVFRASHTSIALAGGVPAGVIAALSGRKIPGDRELSDHYLRWQTFVASTPPEMLAYFPSLGTPQELAEEADSALSRGRIKI